jgi:hypothetical protein
MHGELLFHLVRREGLEGIVAKRKDSPYTPERPGNWIKIKNPAYTQIVGREKMFEKKPSGNLSLGQNQNPRPWDFDESVLPNRIRFQQHGRRTVMWKAQRRCVL